MCVVCVCCVSSIGWIEELCVLCLCGGGQTRTSYHEREAGDEKCDLEGWVLG